MIHNNLNYYKFFYENKFIHIYNQKKKKNIFSKGFKTLFKFNISNICPLIMINTFFKNTK